MRILRDSFTTLLNLGAIFVLGVVVSLLVAHYLGPEGKGIFALVFLLPALCASLGSFGLGAANVYLIRRGEASAAVLVSNSVVVSLAVGLLAAAGAILAWPWLGEKLLPGVSPLLAAVGLLTLPFSLLSDYLLGLVLGAQRVARYNFALLSAKVFSVTAIVVAIVVLGAGVTGTVLASALGSLALLGFAIREVRRVHGIGLGHIRPDFAALKRSLSYGLREHLGNVAMFLSYRIDMFFVAALAGVKAVGIYSVSVMMAEVFLHLPNAVSTILFPHLAGRSLREGANHTARTARVVACIIGLGALVSIPLAEPLVRFAFPESFLPAVPAFYALLPGVWALSVSKVLCRFFTGTLGRPHLNAAGQITAMAVNLPLNFILIPTYGILGAAIASSAAYVAQLAVTLALFSRHASLAPNAALLPREADLTWIIGRLAELKILLPEKSHG